MRTPFLHSAVLFKPWCVFAKRRPKARLDARFSTPFKTLISVMQFLVLLSFAFDFSFEGFLTSYWIVPRIYHSANNAVYHGTEAAPTDTVTAPIDKAAPTVTVTAPIDTAAPTVTVTAPTDTEAAPNDNQAINIKPVAGIIPSLQLYELKEITDNFSTKALICDGTCGKLYYGILKSGQASCIKMLEFNKLPLQDFLSRVHTVSRLKHENVVELLGYCINVDFRFLAYEYAPNGSLHDILHRRKGIERLQPGPVLSWSQRVKIAVGAAKGLQYFHEKPQPNIIHGGIKSSNVLLFNDGIAKIADIKISNQALDVEPILPYDYTTRFVEPDYFVAPKRLSSESEELGSRSDVFMFGVVLLELLTGRKAVDYTLLRSQQNLIKWVTPKLNYYRVNEYIDPRLNGEYPLRQAAEMAAIAASCVQSEPVLRPSMSIVVNRLQPLLNDLPGPSSEATLL